ncbi:PREDICTED: uncharacterized protein LOC104816299 isoform X2 [Tarenaya hassleriana]|uniref:uncharacterized protein LOC104816299 isoform X2 n=1 Tax=Tarenaya hassleriana TaxID=28532 RepID=UPI00053CA45D|nr:PREDICTED: uncharacterized protein LOC104816299 isoform X2 [Tarenaya hassleriana]
MFSSVALSTASMSVVVSASKRPKAKKASPEARKPPSSYGFGGRATTEPTWKCVDGCGACCKLAKDFAFATPEEIFENPNDVELYRSMIGKDGWCIHYDKATRKCSIYRDRPYFCRVQPDVFQSLYGIEEKKFNKEACSCCVDTIKAIYGPDSIELDNFNRAIRSSDSS